MQKSAGVVDSLVGAHERHEIYRVFFPLLLYNVEARGFIVTLLLSDHAVPLNSENISHEQLILVLRLLCVEFSRL